MVEEIFSFEKYKDFINEISDNPNHKDPHYEYDERNLYDSLKKKNQKVYITTIGTKITGLYVWLILPDDNYIEMIIGLTKEDDSLEEMLSFIETNHKGYQLDYVINPQNINFVKALNVRNAVFEKEQQWLVYKNKIDKLTEFDVILFSQEYQDQYINRHNKDVYWTAEKIIAANDKFRTFLAIEKNTVIGYIDVTYCFEKNEIYDLWVDESFQGKGYEQALLQAAIDMNMPKKMMVLVDVDNLSETEMFKSVGFEIVPGTKSRYASYNC